MNPISKYLEAHAPLILAHRGAGGTMPENTLPSFARALELGGEALELDVRITGDGQLAVFHDETIERITEGKGPVRSLPLWELQGLDAGFRFSLDGGETFPFRGRGVKVPSLREAMEAFPEVRINVDIKDPDPRGAELLSDLIRRMRAQSRILCASFHTNVLRRFRQLEPGVATSASKAEAARFIVACWPGLERFLRPRFNALQIPFYHKGIRLVRPQIVSHAHGLGLSVHVWTINEPDAMLRLLNIGVDGIITDYPDRLLAVRTRWLEKRGYLVNPHRWALQ